METQIAMLIQKIDSLQFTLDSIYKLGVYGAVGVIVVLVLFIFYKVLDNFISF